MRTELTSSLVSADSHVNEPRDLWSLNLPAGLREQAMTGLAAEDDGGWELVLNGQRVGKAGDTEEQRLAVLEPENRFEVMRHEGVAAECIFPTIGLSVWMLEDPDAGKYSCRIYNEWIHDQLQRRSGRFACAGLVPTWRIEDAIEEVAFIAERGLKAVMLPTVPANDLTTQSAVSWPNCNHRNWDPLWKAIEETRLPIVMHQGTGHDMVWYRGPGAYVANLIATQSMAPRTAALLATSGVLEQHPDLHFVFVEYNAGWLAWIMETIDFYDVAFERYGPHPSGRSRLYPRLAEPPSFYLKRQVHATFQDDATCLRNLPLSGVEALMWGADYPHEEGTFPNSLEVVDRLAGTLSEDQARLVFRDNAARVFGFDRELLTTPL